MKNICLVLALLILANQNVCARTLDADYFTFDVPNGWDVVMEPTWEEKNVSLVVARADKKAAATLVAGETHGTRMDIIASMFAQMFQTSLPVERQGNVFTVPYEKENVSGRQNRRKILPRRGIDALSD
ncbi:hypothetical protein [uncultured Desulfovibrio sp.]|uniref:hypothetical protein n=1 Tax=uncultured Desulfovibrio sp. TaxID=167968 RepID=UPI00262FEF62|nr:hypothetical protein [uncultured Desulfovibrio sp.]